MYIVYMVFPLPTTLVKTMAKNLAKQLVKHMVKNLDQNRPNLVNTSEILLPEANNPNELLRIVVFGLARLSAPNIRGVVEGGLVPARFWRWFDGPGGRFLGSGESSGKAVTETFK